MRLARHVARMREKKAAYRILMGNPKKKYTTRKTEVG
jgi:hypothetical protein